MAPSQFFIRLQVGIIGGFAPPTPTAVYSINFQPDESKYLNISSRERPEGEPVLTEESIKHLARENYSSQIDRIHNILRELPEEQPPGSEDIYGLDKQVVFNSDDLEFCNGGPTGCGDETSQVQADDEQKEKFKEVVRLVMEIVGGS